MSYTLTFKPAFLRSLRKLPKKLVLSVDRTLQVLKKTPQLVPAKKLSGLGSVYRIRLGDYRLVYHRNDKDKKILLILCAHRKDIYRRLKDSL